jgi:hypothetical protein
MLLCCRSGSTLLETMLDAHPNIWGMGEDSIFNGRLNSFRTDLVAAASNNREVRKVVNKHGNAIVQEMFKLAHTTEKAAETDKSKNSKRRSKSKKPSGKDSKGQSDVKHVVDKMLFNYRNIGMCLDCFYTECWLPSVQSICSCRFYSFSVSERLNSTHYARSHGYTLQLLQAQV